MISEKRRMPRFDVAELLLISAAVFLAGTVVGTKLLSEKQFPRIGFIHPDDQATERDLMARFGPNHYSGGPEEWIVRDVFHDERDGIYADIGAFKAIVGSNTYYLEQTLGWSGLAVDASPDFTEEWRRERPRAKFVQAFVDATDGETRVLQISDDHPSVSSASGEFVGLFKKPNRSIEVTSARLDTLLERAGITRLDFLSLDVELGEPAVLEGFTIERARPRLVCVEALAPVRQRIIDYFAAHDYVMLGKYLRVDEMNLYFAPKTVH